MGIPFSARDLGAVSQKDIMCLKNNFHYKHISMAWVGVIYFEKCNNYVLITCIRHCVRGESIQNYFKIFSFLLIWDKNLGSHNLDEMGCLF